MLESLFNKVPALRDCDFIRKRHQHRCFTFNYAKHFQNTYPEEALQTAASKEHVIGVTDSDKLQRGSDKCSL